MKVPMDTTDGADQTAETTALVPTAEEWSALAALSGFEAGTVWGYVTFTFGVSGWDPGDEAELSEAACRYADAFWLGGYPLLGLSLFLLGKGRRPRRDVEGALDTLTVAVGLYRQADGARLEATAPDGGRLADDLVRIGEVEVR